MAKKDVNEIPDETDFAAVLKAESDWFTLGVFFGLSVGDLTFIKHDCRNTSILQYYIAIYGYLQYDNDLKTWGQIADVLRKMGNPVLAREISGGKRPRDNATDATPPLIRKKFSKQQVKDLSNKIKKWKMQRKFTIQKLEKVAELPQIKDGNTKVAVSDAHWILQLLGIVVDVTKTINVHEVLKQCEATCISEHSVYQEMMEEFMKFGSNISKMFGLSEMDTIKFPVSFDSLPLPLAENLKKEIQKLRQEVELIDDVFEFVENTSQTKLLT